MRPAAHQENRSTIDPRARHEKRGGLAHAYDPYDVELHDVSHCVTTPPALTQSVAPYDLHAAWTIAEPSRHAVPASEGAIRQLTVDKSPRNNGRRWFRGCLRLGQS
jgi:hypothetical protein